MQPRELLATAIQHHRAGRLDEADTLYRQILEADADHPDSLHMLGLLAYQRGQSELAIELIGRAIAGNDAVPSFHYNLGNALRANGRLEEAVTAYGAALTLRPGHPATHLNLSNVLHAQGKLEEAAEACRRAIELKPDFAEAHHNRGLACLKLGRPEEAVASCRRALSYKSDYVAAHVVVGHALQALGRSADAELSYQRALALDPDCGEAELGWAMATIPLVPVSFDDAVGARTRFDARVDTLEQWSRAHPGKLGEAVGTIQPFYLAYRPSDVTSALSRYGALASAEATAYWSSATHFDSRPRQDRIRLVIVSGQLKRHPVWEIILRGLVAHLDRKRFEVFLYHTGATDNEETAWARGQVDHFAQGPKPIRQWLAEIAAARPDAIFYPEVGMDSNTCILAAQRLAPLQIACWGHPVTTGLPTIDWFVSAELLESPKAQQHYREKLILLPGTGVCTEFSSSRKEPWDGPDRRKGVVRFALCQQPLKFGPEDDRLLAQIAKSVGPAEFWLATPANMPWTAVRLRERLAVAFRAEGLDPDAYLRTTPWLPRAQFLSFLDEMDIYLDCPAFSGYTTAWQALHGGLPIITLEGPYLRQRLAAGLLRQVGALEGIAGSREQYLAAAIRWANEFRNTDRWAGRRAELRAMATRADGNTDAVRTFEQKLWEASRESA